MARNYKVLMDPRASLKPLSECYANVAREIPGMPLSVIKQIIGTEKERETALRFCQDMGAMLSKVPVKLDRPVGHTFKSLIKESAEVTKLRQVKRAMAHQVYNLLPMPVSGYQDENYPGDLTYQNFAPAYQAVAAWLQNWDLELGAEVVLGESAYAPYSDLAILEKRRWEICQAVHALFELGDEMTPSFLWLLQACSRCLEAHRPGKKAAPNREAIYRAEKRHTDGMKDKKIVFIDVNDDDYLRAFHELLDGYAVQLADRSSQFKREVFKPYLSARRRWQRNVYNNPDLNFYIEPTKPGPKKGQDWPKVTPDNAKALKVSSAKRSRQKKDLPQK